jgi:hypothetical protein
MCRHSLGITEAPAKQLAERHVMSLFAEDMTRWRMDIGQAGQGQGALAELLREALGPEPAQPPPPPRPPQGLRIINIGDDVQVSEADVSLVMMQAEVDRGAAIRALRRYEGDLVNSILMLTSPDPPRPPPAPVVREPLVDPSDDQTTAWFLQRLFGDSSSYAWNSYSDLKFRMGNGMRGREYWIHSNFNGIESQVNGYDSA